MSDAAEPVDVDAVRSWIADRPFMEWMGLTVDELRRDRVVLSLMIAPHMRYIQGMLHGGLTCVLLDTAIGVAARLQVPSNQTVRTILLQTRYLAPGRGSHAQVEGTAALTNGRVIGQGVVRIDGTEVAAGHGEFAVVHRDRHVRAAHQARGSVAGR